MMHLRRCNVCKLYTLQEECPECHIETGSPKPPKYSVEDKYGSYRRKAKIAQWRTGGLL